VTASVPDGFVLPEHVTVYVLLAEIDGTVAVPDVGLPVPVEKLVPVHEVAFDDDHWSVNAASPSLYEVTGLIPRPAVRTAVGAGGPTDTLDVVQAEYAPSESCVRALNVLVPLDVQVWLVERTVLLVTYPLAGSHSSVVPLLFQSIAYRTVSPSGSAARKVYDPATFTI